MSNATIDPSLRPSDAADASSGKRSTESNKPGGLALEQNGPYPHRTTSASISDIAQQLAHAVEPGRGGDGYASGHGGDGYGQGHGGDGYPHHTPMGPPSAQYAHYGSDVLGLQDSPGDGSDKKKIKTTRACDECRRKKIKCDGESDKTGDQCGNCQRTNAECLYTKPAQKRGPSRGYIRELSDRVASLEERGLLGSPMTPQQASPFFATPDTAEMRGYKRTHSMSEHPASASASASASTPTVAPFARMGGASAGTGPSTGTVQVQFKVDAQPATKPLTETERTQLNGWMHIAQTRFALLPDSLEAAEALLNTCPDGVRDAFVAALRATLSLPDSPDRTLYREAYTAALGLVHQPKAASAATNVVHLQICVLLVYLSNTAGPDPSGAEPDGSVFLAKGFSIASHLHLGAATPPSADAAAALAHPHGRRAFGYLQLLAHWSAAAHGGAPPAAPPFRLAPSDGHAIPFDAFLLMAQLPDLELLGAHARRTEPLPAPAARMDEYLDAVRLGLGMAGGRDPAAEPVVTLTTAALAAYRFMVYAKDCAPRWTPAIARDAAAVVAGFHGAGPGAAGDMTFFPIAHQTLGLALLVLCLALREKDKETKDEAKRALEAARAALGAGALQEDGWRAALLARVEGALKGDKGAEDVGRWVREGWMGFFG